jgi:hypothetical protein
VQVAVVSANAFDKALENDVGISPQDFITKPVRHAELLDWLAQRLKLQWLYREPATDAKTPDAQTPDASLAVYLPAPALQTLRDAISLGYLRGILNQLDQLRQTQPDARAWIDQVETLARSYEFESITPMLDRVKMKVEP